ncbi:MAG: glycoside hydrolase [Bacteroidales bacterium]|nr:glycoside hydrolase [Bacteroidales bacterium]
MKRSLLIMCISLACSFLVTHLKAENLKRIIPLSGYWKFSIGDDNKWSDPSLNDSDWDQIKVPGSWEEQGYNDYNGYAWYRKTFRVEEISTDEILYLLIGQIDDVEETYLNGKKIGNSGEFPPNFVTAYNWQRKYIIPKGLLKANSTNTIAIKVYDTFLGGGITGGRIGIYVDADYEFIDLRLDGKWKFKTGENKDWKLVNYDDKNWKQIDVPSDWEMQGYTDYDGFAWYRNKFKLPAGFDKNNLYLSLGKIDDEDDVFLNGQHIGSVFELEKDGEYRMSGYEYNARRIYKIPPALLNDGLNVICIRVYDGQGRGGIYEGPIGIMSKENYRKYKSKYQSSRSFWDYMFDEFFMD